MAQRKREPTEDGVASLLESWITSPNPVAIPLATFKNLTNMLPAALDAPVRMVSGYRNLGHEYVYVHCSHTLPTTQRPTEVYLRLENSPSGQDVKTRNMGTRSSLDTVKASHDSNLLRERGASTIGGHLVFGNGQNVACRITLRDVLDIYDFLASSGRPFRLLHLTGRRYWFCYSLLACLRGCEPCFGGQWTPTLNYLSHRYEEVSNQLKEKYLEERHPNCCHHPLRLALPIFPSSELELDAISAYSGPMPGSPSLCMISLGSRSKYWLSRSSISTVDYGLETTHDPRQTPVQYSSLSLSQNNIWLLNDGRIESSSQVASDSEIRLSTENKE